MATAHRDPRHRPLSIERISYTYDVQHFLLEYMYRVANHSKPHLFWLRKNTENKTMCQYKIWSHYKIWLPSGVDATDQAEDAITNHEFEELRQDRLRGREAVNLSAKDAEWLVLTRRVEEIVGTHVSCQMLLMHKLT